MYIFIYDFKLYKFIRKNICLFFLFSFSVYCEYCLFTWLYNHPVAPWGPLTGQWNCCLGEPCDPRASCFVLRMHEFSQKTRHQVCRYFTRHHVTGCHRYFFFLTNCVSISARNIQCMYTAVWRTSLSYLDLNWLK